MALIDKKITNPIRYHQDNANTVIGQASTMKALFDQGAEDLRVKLNGVIDELLATTGAQQIGIDPAKGLGNTLADALTNIKNYMELGASGISATTIGTGSGNTVQSQLEWLLLQIQNVVLNQIPNGTVTMDKLSTTLADLINGHTTQLAQTAKKTTQSLLYFVSPSGNDANDGLTPETAFKTIQKAIDNLPQIINHPVDINLAPGTYDEEVLVDGFIGKSKITIRGASNQNDSVNYIIGGITVEYSTIRVDVIGIRATRTNLPAIFLRALVHARVVHCSVVNAASIAGIQCNTGGMIMVSDCLVSNRLEGIRSDGCTLASLANAGTGNSVGLYSILGGVIAKDGTQPTGTVNELTHSGGVIR